MTSPVVNLSAACSLAGEEIRIKSPDASRNVFRFLGIPYALPPTGNLRFCDPQPFPLWDGCRPAKEWGPVCPQDFEMLKMIPFHIPVPDKVSEDCLYLNVWTPSVNSTSLLPVMVWIHGGGFVSGFTNMYDGAPLCTFQDVVYVSINYRLGAFGFMCTGDSVAKGNQGLLDQLEALSWIQRYIRNFGGDPDNVTIFGQSAGGVSVSLLVMSQLSKGLFRRAISQSGTGLFSTLIYSAEKSAKYVKDKLVTIGCPADATSEQVMSIVRGQTSDVLVKLFIDGPVPVVDGRVMSENVISLHETADPQQQQQYYVCRPGPPVDYLQGCNSDEGVLMFDLLKLRFGLALETMTAAATRMTLQQMSTMWISGLRDPAALVEAVWIPYFGSEEPDVTRCQQGFAEFFADLMFVMPAVRLAELHSANTKTYLYSFHHRPAYSSHPAWVGANHGDDVPLMLGMVFDDPLMSLVQISDDDRKLSRQMMSYWANFAKNGNPNGEGLIEWPQYDVTERRHMAFKTSAGVECRLKADRVQFWQTALKNLI